MELINTHFPDLQSNAAEKLSRLPELYRTWNERINVISRRDMDHFEERHLLHSLSIALFFRFAPGTTVLDVGTGGGFPGIPLAILFPETSFVLADSIAKKIHVVDEVKNALELRNVTALCTRVEKMDESFDFVVSRAVTALPDFVRLVQNRIRKNGFNVMKNGIIYLKGGEFADELAGLKSWHPRIFELNGVLEGEFFSTKKIVYLTR